MTASKNGVSAKELQRQLGVTYKCAWRMAHQIRKLLQEDSNLKGTVEVDETYFGGKRSGKRGRGAAGKTPIVGMVERGGKVVARVVENTTAETVLKEINKTVAPKSTLMTDEYSAYRSVPKTFKHEVIKHAIKQYVRGNVHTNTIEGFWSQLKRSIDGTFHHVSRKHLQTYVGRVCVSLQSEEERDPDVLPLDFGSGCADLASKCRNLLLSVDG